MKPSHGPARSGAKRERGMSDGTGDMQRLFRRALMVILGLVLVSLIAYLSYLLGDFRQSLHDIPH